MATVAVQRPVLELRLHEPVAEPLVSPAGGSTVTNARLPATTRDCNAASRTCTATTIVSRSPYKIMDGLTARSETILGARFRNDTLALSCSEAPTRAVRLPEPATMTWPSARVLVGKLMLGLSSTGEPSIEACVKNVSGKVLLNDEVLLQTRSE